MPNVSPTHDVPTSLALSPNATSLIQPPPSNVHDATYEIFYKPLSREDSVPTIGAPTPTAFPPPISTALGLHHHQISRLSEVALGS